MTVLLGEKGDIMEFESTHECGYCDFCDEECSGLEHEPCKFWNKEAKKKWHKLNNRKMMK